MRVSPVSIALLVPAVCAVTSAAADGKAGQTTVDLSALRSRHRIPLDQFNLTDAQLALAARGLDGEAASPSSRKLLHDNFMLYYGCGVDVPGNDLISVKSGKKVDCVVTCEIFLANCEGSVWTSYEGGTCWYKTKTSTSYGQAKTDAASAVFLNGEGPRIVQSGAKFDFDMPGYDIGNMPAKTAHDCYQPCVDNKACYATTFTKYNGGTCWFKSQAASLVPSPGAISSWYWKDWKIAGPCMGGLLTQYVNQ